MGEKGKYWDEGKKRRIKEERGGRAWFCFFHLIFFIFIFAIMTSKYKNTETTHKKGKKKIKW